MNGVVIPRTPIAVDFWQVRKCSQVRLFFLSHMHSDHTVGLTSTWSNRPIYCSLLTAKLLHQKLQVKEKWIYPLEEGRAHMLPLDEVGKETVTVTLIDANHCPGSVMFLFEGYFGTILFTGDFRYTPTMLQEPCLSSSTQIDVLYLDNTNLSSSCAIPSRQEATKQIKDIIRMHPEHDIIIGLYKLGKECLLVELGVEFQTWVVVTRERMETLRILDLPDVFTTELGAGRIRVVEQNEITPLALTRWNKQHPTVAIVPTSRPLNKAHSSLYVVPYSDHSSSDEIMEFVSYMKPLSIIPIVRPRDFSLPSSWKVGEIKKMEVPESVQLFMKEPHKLKTPEKQKCFSGRSRIPKGVVFDSPVRNAEPSKPTDLADLDSSELEQSPSVNKSGQAERDYCLSPNLCLKQKTLWDIWTRKDRKTGNLILQNEKVRRISAGSSELLTKDKCPADLVGFESELLNPNSVLTETINRGSCGEDVRDTLSQQPQILEKSECIDPANLSLHATHQQNNNDSIHTKVIDHSIANSVPSGVSGVEQEGTPFVRTASTGFPPCLQNSSTDFGGLVISDWTSCNTPINSGRDLAAKYSLVPLENIKQKLSFDEVVQRYHHKNYL
ncbi:5' exonuclease Apollo isoform X2 [Polypterus senegalus]|nr:5' exonuclease Apollo isoform X2 [Polypterus senegalus]